MVKKKFLALTMAAVTAMSLFAGCTKGKDDPKKNDDDKFYIYSWNTEAGQRIKKLYTEKYGAEEAKKLEFVATGKSETYQPAIDKFWNQKDNEKYPDMIALEADYIKKYTDSDKLLPVEDLGIKEDDCKDMYDYTVTVGKDKDGKLKALSWQSCPGCMVYRTDLAQEYLGVSKPEEVQPFFKDWDTIKTTAQTIADKSDKKCRLFQGYSELQRPYQNGRKAAWVKDKKINIDPVMEKYMEDSKEFCDKGFCSAKEDDQQFKDAWNAKMGTDEIFAYTSCTWFNQFTLAGNIKGKGKEDTTGKWGMIDGPQEFSWGGTWLAATKDCSNKEIAGKVLKLLTEKDSMKLVYTGEDTGDEKTSWGGDFPNNKAAVEELAAQDNSENAVTKIMGGQDPIKFFKEKAEKITVPEMCGEDLDANKFFNDHLTAYITGKESKDDAIAGFKKDLKGKFNYIED